MCTISRSTETYTYLDPNTRACSPGHYATGHETSLVQQQQCPTSSQGVCFAQVGPSKRATLPKLKPTKTASRERSQFRGRAIPATRSVSHPLRDGFGCCAPRSKDHQRLKQQPPPPNIDVIKSKSVTPSSDCSFQKRHGVRQSQPPQIRYRAADIRYIRPSTKSTLLDTIPSDSREASQAMGSIDNVLISQNERGRLGKAL